MKTGPEVTAEAVRVLECIAKLRPNLRFDIASHDFGGIAIDNTGEPLPDATLKACQASDAILLGAVGGPKWGTGKIRPEQGILKLRKALDLYANIRPALFPSDSLLEKSPLKEELAKGAYACLQDAIYLFVRRDGNYCSCKMLAIGVLRV